MPRITGPTIAEHVATQEAAVLAAARRLFEERGVAAVSMGDIAAEVGLRRTSLYRYFPTKAHILARWFDLEMTPLIERSAEVTGRDASPGERLRSWLDLQLDFLTDASHGALMDAATGGETLPEDVLAEFGRRHHELYATLVPVLREAGARRADLLRTRSLLVAGLLRSSAELLGQGVPKATVRRELHRTAAATVGL